jgi:glycosyltransferase involved in cell wall biosynthesis
MQTRNRRLRNARSPSNSRDDGDLSVLHVISGLGDGGAEAVLFRLVTAATTFRHAVVSLMDEGKYGPLLRDAGIPVHSLGMPRSRVARRGLRRLWRVLQSSDPDVIQTWMYHADLVGGGIARMAGHRAIVWGLHNTYLDQRRTRLIARACAVASWAVPRTIISCSKGAASLHVSLGYDRGRMTIVPNGYNVSSFSHDAAARRALRNAWGIPGDAVVLGTVARWDPQKDHPNLLQALSEVDVASPRSIRLVLVGPDMTESNPDLMSLLRKHGWQDRTVLLGRRRDVPAIMSALDLHVLPSVAEAFPNVLAEAMACETPCVVTDTGDAALIVGETGWVVPPRDPHALARALDEAMTSLADHQSGRELQVAARARIVDNFSLDRMVRGYADTWRNALRE